MSATEDFSTLIVKIKAHICKISPELKPVFEHVDASGFELHTVIRDPYVALVGAIIGQKISYVRAKKMRGQLFAQFGDKFLPTDILAGDLGFLDQQKRQITLDVSRYIVDNSVDLSTESGIRSLTTVRGIGEWTVQTVLLTTMKSWDIFPLQDKFLQKHLKSIYGPSYDPALVLKWSPYRSVVTWYLWRYFP